MDNPVQTIQDRIDDEYKVAFKAKEKKLYMVLRFVLSVIKQKTIDTRKELTNEEIIALLKSEVKKRKDALKDFEKGGREDLIADTQYEVDVISNYLPEEMPDDQLQALVTEALTEIGATSPADIGKAMGAVMAKVKGQADGGRVKDMVMKALKG